MLSLATTIIGIQDNPLTSRLIGTEVLACSVVLYAILFLMTFRFIIIIGLYYTMQNYWASGICEQFLRATQTISNVFVFKTRVTLYVFGYNLS